MGNKFENMRLVASILEFNSYSTTSSHALTKLSNRFSKMIGMSYCKVRVQYITQLFVT